MCKIIGDRPRLFIVCLTLAICLGVLSCEIKPNTADNLHEENSVGSFVEKKADKFNIRKELQGELKGPDKHFLGPAELAIYKSYLLVFDDDNDPMMHFLKLPEFNFIKAFGKNGKGPGEFESPRTNNQFVGSSLWVTDWKFTRLMNLDSMLFSDNYQSKDQYVHPPEINAIYSLIHVSDTLSIGCSADGKGRYFLLNPETDDIKYVDFFPGIDREESHRGTLGQLYYSRNAIRPDGQKIVSAMAFFPRIDFINTDGSVDFSVVFPTKKELATNKDGISIPKSLEYYTDIYVTQEYIYMLYNGIDPEKEDSGWGGKNIHILDWEGNAIADLSLDKQILNFAVDEARKKIYGITDFGLADVSIEQAIIEFELPNLSI